MHMDHHSRHRQKWTYTEFKGGKEVQSKPQETAKLCIQKSGVDKREKINVEL